MIPSLQFAFTSWANDNQKMRQPLSWPNLIQKKLDDSCTHPSVAGCFRNVSKMRGLAVSAGQPRASPASPGTVTAIRTGLPPEPPGPLPKQPGVCKRRLYALTSGTFLSVREFRVAPSKSTRQLNTARVRTSRPLMPAGRFSSVKLMPWRFKETYVVM